MRQQFSIPLVLKRAAPTAEGEFAGIGATWLADRDGERFARGCFADSLASWRKRGALPPVLFGHDPNSPAGALVHAVETEQGLEIVGRLALGTEVGARAYALLKTASGALAMSVGFIPTHVDRNGPVPVFLHVDLVEVSLVATPAQPGAVVTSVKTMAERFCNRRDFEHAARDALHLSANEAKRLAAGGWAAMTRNESEAAEHAPLSAAITSALSRIANAR